MNISFRKNKTFASLLIAYVLFLLLPIVVITSVIFSQYSHMIKRDTMRNDQEKLDRINQTLSIAMTDISRIAARTQNDETLSSYRLSKNSYNIMKAQSLLSSYRAGNSFLVDIVYYSREKNLLFSSMSTYSKQTFMNLVYNSSSLAKDRFWYLAGNSSNMTILKPETVVYYKQYPRRILTCIYPIPQSYTIPYCSLIFLVDADAMDRVLSSSLDSGIGMVYVVNSSEEVLFSNDAMASSDVAASLLSKSEQNGERFSGAIALDQEYLVSYLKSPETGWHYLMAVPTANALSQASYVSRLFVLCMVLILLASLAFFGFGIKYNYNPIKKLGALAKNLANVRESASEFELIRDAMDNLSGENRELIKKINESREARKEFLLSELLLGKRTENRAFFSEAEELDMRFVHKYYGVGLIRLNRDGAAVSTLSQDAMKLIQDYLLEQLNGHIKENIDSVSLLCIYNVPVKNVQSYVPIFHNLQAVLTRDFHLSTSIGLGGLYEAVSGIGKSFMEANYALEYQPLSGKNSVIMFDSVIINDDYEKDYPVKEIVCLQGALKEGSAEKSSGALLWLLEVMQTRKMQIHMARFICYDVIYSIIHYMREENDEIAGIDRLVPAFSRLTQLNSIEEFTEYIHSIGGMLRTMIENQSTAIEKKAMAYVKQQYTNPNFSVQAVAENLNVSPGHLSRYFKKKTGQTLIEYIKSVRIEEAKRLLCETDMPVSTIVKHVGYIDNSSFNRGFKQAVNDTPGNYRAKHRKTIAM